MKYEWLDEYCLSKAGVVKDYKVEWEAVRYMVGGKMFAMQGGDKYGKPIITLKCEPLFGEALRQQFSDVVPGYYMNKLHWNSVYLEGNVPDKILRQMIDMSHRLVLEGLSKKTRERITRGD